MNITLKTLLVILSISFVQIACQNSEKSAKQTKEAVAMSEEHTRNAAAPQAATLNTEESLPAELVCMVNDAYMGKKQFPVPVGDKIYFGCCEMCVDKLKNTDQYRFGIDPLTKEKVDKTEAYIVLQSKETGAVLYFKSKENYKKYKARG